jgi:hypothetical protein
MKQTKTIPFNWEEYNNNRDKYKVVTRDGDEVTQLTKFEGITSFPFVGCHVPNGIHVLRGWQIDGKFLECPEQHRNDLQLQYEEEVVGSWVNLYRADNDLINTSVAFITEEAAKSIGIYTKGYIKTINLNDLV